MSLPTFTDCPECCECNSPLIQTKFRSGETSRIVFAPLDLVPLSPWGSGSLASASLFYSQSYRRYYSSYGYSGSLWGNTVNGNGCLGCWERFHDYRTSASIIYKDEYRSTGSTYAFTRSYEGFTGWGGRWSHEITNWPGQEECDTDIIESGSENMGGGNLYEINGWSATGSSATYRFFSTSSLTGGVGGSDSCPNGNYKALDGVAYGEMEQTLSGEFRVEDDFPRVKGVVSASATSSTWGTGNPSSYLLKSAGVLSTGDGVQYGQRVSVNLSARESFYRVRFNPPKWSNRYRVTWNERFCPVSGSAIEGVTVLRGGKFRPTVTFSASPSGSRYTAKAIPVMSPTGTVTGFKTVYSGSGYVLAPSMSFSLGRTTATASCLVLGGKVTAYTVTNGGDYLPTVLFNRPSVSYGVAATASVLLDEAGGIESFNFTRSGSGYEYGQYPTLTLVSSSFATLDSASFVFHYGTAVPRSASWNGEFPVGYDYATVSASFWPTFPEYAVDGGEEYYVLRMPEASGSVFVSDVVYECGV